jgi:hypothetical protein
METRMNGGEENYLEVPLLPLTISSSEDTIKIRQSSVPTVKCSIGVRTYGPAP